jgi:hypothetical protein
MHTGAPAVATEQQADRKVTVVSFVVEVRGFCCQDPNVSNAETVYG